RPRKGRFLVRDRHIGADIAARGERVDEGSKFLLAHRLTAVFAGDAVSLEPVVVNDRRARMLDRPADYANCAANGDPVSSATELRSTPIAGHSTSIISPDLSQPGGSALASFFTGVPVEIMSPGLSVMKVVT